MKPVPSDIEVGKPRRLVISHVLEQCKISGGGIRAVRAIRRKFPDKISKNDGRE